MNRRLPEKWEVTKIADHVGCWQKNWRNLPRRFYFLFLKDPLIWDVTPVAKWFCGCIFWRRVGKFPHFEFLIACLLSFRVASTFDQIPLFQIHNVSIVKRNVLCSQRPPAASATHGFSKVVAASWVLWSLCFQSTYRRPKVRCKHSVFITVGLFTSKTWNYMGFS